MYKEIKEIRTQLSIAAYLFASPKQHVDPPSAPLGLPPHPTPLEPSSSKCYPQRRRLRDCWVLGNILCKLQVKCENSSDWFNSAMPTKMLVCEGGSGVEENREKKQKRNWGNCRNSTKSAELGIPNTKMTISQRRTEAASRQRQRKHTIQCKWKVPHKWCSI